MQAWQADGRAAQGELGGGGKQAGADPDAALAEFNAAIAKYGAGP